MQQIFRWARWLGIAGSSKYYWKLWGVSLLILLTVVEIGAIWKVVKALAGWAVNTTGHRSVTARLAGATLYANAVLSIILSWRLSNSWRKIRDFWIIIEHGMTASKIPKDNHLDMKMTAVIIMFIVCGLGEHMMSILSAIGLDCPPSLWLKKYTLMSHGFYYSQNSETMELFKWRKIREAYVKQAALVRKVNEVVGSLILLSNSCNFYFTCLQLFLGITQGMSDTVLKQIYYLLSFIWLCIRTTLVVLSAADVNICSKGALPYLFDYRTQAYNLEIERLEYQLSKDFVALSGMGFFFLTKSLLLQMAGAVVTYELVLIQFDDTDRNSTNATTY